MFVKDYMFNIILLKMSVLFLLCTDEPEVSIEGFDGNWYINRENVQLTCLADSNPAISTFQWRL